MISLSNLLKQRNIISQGQNTRIIDANQLLAMKLEAQRRAMYPEGLPEEQEEAEPEITPEEIRAEAEEIRAQAQKTLEDAREQASGLVEEARGQVEQIREGARQEGFTAGYKDGQQKAAEELEVLRQELEQHRGELEEQHRQRLLEMEGQVLEAVCDVIERTFGVSFDSFGQILLHLVGQAVLKIEGAKEFTVRIHPGQYEYLKEHQQELEDTVGPSVTIRLEADTSLGESGCMIETDSGFFDCSLDVEFQNLLKAVRMLSV